MVSNQEPLKVGDLVEVTGDPRPIVKGRRGVIDRIIDGNVAEVKFDHIGRGKKAKVLLEHLTRIEENNGEQ